MEDSTYHAGVYVRLSSEDERSGESASIENQKSLLTQYVLKQGWVLTEIYCDDGYSGVGFERPGFGRMMEDIRAGRINCVIVKDLSRLGREYIETGRLIQKIFPALEVRFIALTDGYDSETAGFHEKNLVLPVRNFINDSYCMDISRKVRSQQKIMREKGEFIGAFTVYGYQRSREKRSRLVPDEYASRVVRRIFALRLDGYSMTAIAKRLDGQGVLSPMEYKKLHGEAFSTGFPVGAFASWSAAAVRRILENELYTGTMVQGKRRALSYKLKRPLPLPSSEWVRVENTHEAVISQEIYRYVEGLSRIDGRAGKGMEKSHVFYGLLFCGDCGRPMAQRRRAAGEGGKAAYICSTCNKGQGCSSHRIGQEILERVVVACVELQMKLGVCREQIRDIVHAVSTDIRELPLLRRETVLLEQTREGYERLDDGLARDLEHGVISPDDYKEFHRIYKDRSEALGKAACRQKQALLTLWQAAQEADRRLEEFGETMVFGQHDREALMAFVERVLVYEGGKIEIMLKVREPLWR